MSLFGTIQQSAGALQVAQIGLQVVGNNIANANTPGFLRQSLEQASARAVRDGNLLKGAGVRATGIVQIVDKQVAERMLNAKTALAGAQSLEKAYTQLEEMTGDLDNSGLNHQFSLFNNSLHELSTQPGDKSLRDFVILQAETLTDNIRSSRQRAVDGAEIWNTELGDMSAEINRLSERIAKLNLDIATIEGGGLIQSDATGLRDQRLRDLESLSEYININVQEQESGTVAVFVGGDYLVSNGNYREVKSAYSSAAGGIEIRIVETDSPIQASGGKAAAARQARDEVFGAFIEELDDLASALIRSVNEAHSQGQGRTGFRDLLSTVPIVPGVPLKDAELAYEPRNGSFDISVVDDNGQVISQHRIAVRKLGQVTDSTINSIVSDMNAIDGVTASLTSSGQVQIESDSVTSSFTFGQDTSGFLAAAGINTFFTGRNALDIEVNSILSDNPDMLAISYGGVGEDTDALTELVDLIDKPVEHLGGDSVRSRYEQSIGRLAQNVHLQSSAAAGLETFYDTLRSQHLGISGVNIDEESIKMLTYQRAFQASSRVISTASEMLEILVSL